MFLTRLQPQWLDLDLEFGTTNQRSTQELLYPVLMSLVLLSLRHILDKFMFAPIGTLLGLTNVKLKKPKQNPVLEEAYSRGKNWNRRQILDLAKQVDMSERQIWDWLRLTVAQNKPTTLAKFCESFWKALGSAALLVGGLVVVWDKVWFWDLNQCWSDYANQTTSSEVLWYFMSYMAWFWASLFSLYFDVRRKDFNMMLLHHLVAITITSLAWKSNLVRIFTVALVLHDSSDAFIEAAKMTTYVRYKWTSLVLLIIFTLVWIVVRLGLCPFWIFKHYMVDLPTVLPFFLNYSLYYVLLGLICAILCFDCIWSYFIFKLCYMVVSTGESVGDTRSDDDDDDL